MEHPPIADLHTVGLPLNLKPCFCEIDGESTCRIQADSLEQLELPAYVQKCHLIFHQIPCCTFVFVHRTMLLDVFCHVLLHLVPVLTIKDILPHPQNRSKIWVKKYTCVNVGQLYIINLLIILLINNLLFLTLYQQQGYFNSHKKIVQS